MGILTRIGDLIKANVNDIIDKAENPQKLLKQMIRDLDNCLDEAKTETVRVLAELDRQEKAVEAKAREVAEWLKRAETALKDGSEDMARKALERKLEHEKMLTALQDRADEVRASADTLKANIQTMQDKTAEARSRLSALQVRSASAQQSARSLKVLDQVTSPSGGLAKFDKLERRIDDIERQNEVHTAVNQIVAQDVREEQEFAEMEKKVTVDAELAGLRNRLQ